MGYISAIAFATLAFLFYCYYPGGQDTQWLAYSVPPPPKLTGPLGVNDALSDAEHILVGQILGPESIVVDGDTLYTGLADGRIIAIIDGVITKEVRLTKETNCGSYEMEPLCGRPLGLQLYRKNQVVVADSYLGVFIVNMENGNFRRVLDPRVSIDGALPRFVNDVDVLSDDELIVTDSSTRYDRRNAMNDILEGGANGRVFKLKISTGETTVLLDQIHFANGIQILPDRKSFVVAEMTRSRLLRYWLDSGKVETFAENLPGLPDNIRLSTNGTLWIALIGLRHAGACSGQHLLSEYPRLRRFLLQTLPERIRSALLPPLVPAHALVVQMDLSGKIISSMHDPKGKRVAHISQVTDSKDYLYIGSYQMPFIARVRKF